MTVHSNDIFKRNYLQQSEEHVFSRRRGQKKKIRIQLTRWHCCLSPSIRDLLLKSRRFSELLLRRHSPKVKVAIGTGSTCRGESGFFSLQVCSSCGQSHKEQPTWIVCPLRIGNLWRSCIYLGMPPRNHTASQQVHDHNRVGIKFGNNYNY